MGTHALTPRYDIDFSIDNNWQSLSAFGSHKNSLAGKRMAALLSQELGVRLKAMPSEAMLSKFPDLVSFRFASVGARATNWSDN